MFGSDYNSDASDVAKFLMAASHVLLLYPVVLLWPKRNLHSAVILGMMSVLLASTSYHVCFSYEICAFSDPEHHHFADSHFSSMLSPCMSLLYFFDEENQWRENFLVSLLMAASVLVQLSYASGEFPFELSVLVSVGISVSDFVSSMFRKRGSIGRIRWVYGSCLLGLSVVAAVVFYIGGIYEPELHVLWHVSIFVSIALYVEHGPVVVFEPQPCQTSVRE